jgi:hypothetical protein
VARATPAQQPRVGGYAGALRRVPGSGAVAAPRRLSGDTVVIDVLPSGDALFARNREVVHHVRAVPALVPVAVGGAAARFVDQQATLADYLQRRAPPPRTRAPSTRTGNRSHNCDRSRDQAPRPTRRTHSTNTTELQHEPAF